MKRPVNRTHFEKAERIFNALDDEPEMWRVYGETVRRIMNNARQAINDWQIAHSKLRGSAAEKQITIRVLQRRWKKKLWYERPHICVKCGCEVIWATHRVHHIVPVSAGGQFTADNLEIYCANCHSANHSTDSRFECN